MDIHSIISELYERGETPVSELDNSPEDSEELLKNIWKLEKKGWILCRRVDEPSKDTYISLTMEGQHKAETMILGKNTKEGGNVTQIFYAVLLSLMVVAVGAFAATSFMKGPLGQEALMHFEITNETYHSINILLTCDEGGTAVIAMDTIDAFETKMYSYTVGFDLYEKSKDVTVVRTIETRYAIDLPPYSCTYSVNTGGEYTFKYTFDLSPVPGPDGMVPRE